jgi:glycosyltransferase involved in cell wall biosynthesis
MVCHLSSIVAKPMSDLFILATALVRRPPSTMGVAYAPRVEYVELAKAYAAAILDYGMYDGLRVKRLGSALRWLETTARSDMALAWAGYHEARRHKVTLAMSERAGIPFAFYRHILPRPWARRPFVFRFTCWSPRQRLFIRWFNLLRQADLIITDCRSMVEVMQREAGASAEKVRFIRYAVDERYYTPSESPEVGDYIVSVGEPRTRKYPWLMEAVQGLPIQMRILASGQLYARERSNGLPRVLPDNVKISGRHPPHELREIYRRARFVVLPVGDEVFSAGVTVLDEAQACGKAVIATRSRGLQDYVVDGETALLVEPGDTAGLRAAIEYLLVHPKEARRLGENGRTWIQERLTLDGYVAGLGAAVREVMPEALPMGVLSPDVLSTDSFASSGRNGLNR